MLAHRFNDHKHKISYPIYVQPKLNGVRALYHNSNFQSRDEVLWNKPVLQHLHQELRNICGDNMILDGELYLHGKSLQQINGAISIMRKEADSKTLEIQYHVFDCNLLNKPDLPFSERSLELEGLKARCTFWNAKSIHVVPTLLVHQLDAETLYSRYREEGYEGLMYRDPTKAYGFAERCGNKQNRWTHLLKRKAWQDDEFEVVDFNITTGEKGNRGFQLTCKTVDGVQFNVGSGMASGEVDYYTDNPPIGKLARVRYEMLSDGLVPLKPTLEAIL